LCVVAAGLATAPVAVNTAAGSASPNMVRRERREVITRELHFEEQVTSRHGLPRREYAHM
jgi:hypothetical protein